MKNLNPRRSIRKYADKPVSDELLNRLMTEAARTQTMGNLQLYSVIVTRSTEMKETNKTEKKVKVVKETKVSKPVGELTDFEKFRKVQKSGVINMTDIYTGSRLAGISEEKYEDILFHYNEYKEGKRQ